MSRLPSPANANRSFQPLHGPEARKTVRHPFRRGRGLAAWLVLAVGLLGAQVGYGQFTWDGGGLNQNWTNGANWGGGAPANNSSLTFAGTTNTVTNNDFPNFTATGLEFTNTTGGQSFTLSGGAITFSGNITTAAAAGPITDVINLGLSLSGGAAINAGVNHHLTINGNISGNGSLSKSGAGTLTLNGANTFTGNVTIGTNSRLVAANGSALGDVANSVSLANTNARLVLANGVTISNNLTVSDTGNGKYLQFAGNNAVYAGGIVNNETGGSNYLDILSGGAGTTNTVSGPISSGSSLGGGIRVSGGGTVVFTGDNSGLSQVLTVDGGTLRLGNGGTTGTLGTGNTVLSNNSLLDFNRSDALAYAGDISGDGSLNMGGGGALTLSGNNTFTGNVTVNANSGIVAEHNNALGNSGNMVTLTGSNARLVVGDSITIANGLTVANAGNNKFLEFAGTGATYAGDITTLQLSDDFRIEGGGVGTVNTISGRISSSNAAGEVAVTGGGTVVFSGDNSNLTQNVIIGSGTATVLRAAHDNALGTGAVWFGAPGIGTAHNHALELADGVTIGNLIVAGNQPTSTHTRTIIRLQDGASTGTLTGPIVNQTTDHVSSGLALHASTGGVLTVEGVISGGTGVGQLLKTGAGTVVLEGVNTYTGTTTVSAGTLVVNGDQTAATGNTTVASGATLTGNGTIGSATTTIGNGATHGAGDVGAAGVLTHLGNVTYNTGARVQWELFDQIDGNAGGAGAFDQFVVGGTINFQGATTMDLTFNSVGSGVDWTESFWQGSHQWLVYQGSSPTDISNLSLNMANGGLDSSQTLNFSTALGDHGAYFFLHQEGNNIYLRYQAVPEPAGFTLLGLALGAISLIARPRRRMVE